MAGEGKKDSDSLKGFFSLAGNFLSEKKLGCIFAGEKKFWFSIKKKKKQKKNQESPSSPNLVFLLPTGVRSSYPLEDALA